MPTYKNEAFDGMFILCLLAPSLILIVILYALFSSQTPRNPTEARRRGIKEPVEPGEADRPLTADDNAQRYT